MAKAKGSKKPKPMVEQAFVEEAKPKQKKESPAFDENAINSHAKFDKFKTH